MSIVQDPRLSTATAAATTTTGLATVLEMIPADIGKLATLVGLILSSVLIVYWCMRIKSDLKEERRKSEMHELDKERIKAELISMKKAA